jgi:hypothetical protein
VAWTLALLVLALPVAVVVTWALWPAWQWFETRTGIEAAGHMGPATWCYGAMYATTLAVAAAVRHGWRRWRTRAARR